MLVHGTPLSLALAYAVHEQPPRHLCAQSARMARKSTTAAVMSGTLPRVISTKVLVPLRQSSRVAPTHLTPLTRGASLLSSACGAGGLRPHLGRTATERIWMRPAGGRKETTEARGRGRRRRRQHRPMRLALGVARCRAKLLVGADMAGGEGAEEGGGSGRREGGQSSDGGLGPRVWKERER